MGVRNFIGAFGHVAMDYIVSLRRLPTPNTSIEILDRQRYFGGTAGNLARAAGRLGVKVSLAGPFRLRVDYRIFKLGSGALNSPTHRVYAGLNLKF